MPHMGGLAVFCPDIDKMLAGYGVVGTFYATFRFMKSVESRRL